MMQMTIIAVGKLKEKYIKDGITEYTKRLTGIAKVNIVEINDEGTSSLPSLANIAQIKKREGERILGVFPANCYSIALDILGAEITSEQFAEKISSVTLAGQSHIVFIIGGSWGLSEDILNKVDFRLSFGRMTFPHQLMRLVLIEQIYRAFKIIRNEPYHK